MIDAVKWAVPYWLGPTGSGTFQTLAGFFLHRCLHRLLRRLAVNPRLQACVTPRIGFGSGSPSCSRFKVRGSRFEVRGSGRFLRTSSNPDVYGQT